MRHWPLRSAKSWGGAVMVLWAAATAAHAALPPDVVASFGGVYAVDCANPVSPRLRVTADALAVEQGNQRLTGQQAQAAYSYFGKSPPPGYLVALLSEVRGKHSLLFVISQDRKGQYATVDGDAEVTRSLGKLAGRTLFRSCDASQNQRATSETAQAAAPPPRSGPVTAESATSPTELLRNRTFKAKYLQALGPKSQERWLARLEGPAPELKTKKVLGTDYTVIATCKPHDCADNNLLLLYSPSLEQLYGKVYELMGGTTWLGAPPPPVVAEIEKLWRAEWRSR
jgi:Inhibitor of vertebrate lysozyme (Ivy)